MLEKVFLLASGPVSFSFCNCKYPAARSLYSVEESFFSFSLFFSLSYRLFSRVFSRSDLSKGHLTPA